MTYCPRGSVEVWWMWTFSTSSQASQASHVKSSQLNSSLTVRLLVSSDCTTSRLKSILAIEIGRKIRENRRRITEGYHVTSQVITISHPSISSSLALPSTAIYITTGYEPRAVVCAYFPCFILFISSHFHYLGRRLPLSTFFVDTTSFYHEYQCYLCGL